MIALLVALQADLLERDVRFLASPELQGRNNGTEGGRRAAEYVAERFREAGLKPGAEGGWFHDFKAGRNVVGLLPGETAEAVVVGAHHDGHGILQGKIQPGADDNASGVALILQLARDLAKTRPRRSIVFVSFDAEEDGLLGSREFVRAGLHPDVAAAFIFDLVGGRFFPWEAERLYALGAESSAELAARVRATAVDGLDPRPMGVFLIEPFPDFARSDYAAFRAKEVPFVFFSTGTPWYYHTEHDTPEVVDFPKLARVCAYARKVVEATAQAPERPRFRRTAPSMEDVAAVREGLATLLGKDVRWPEGKREAAARLLKDVEAMKEPEPKVLQKAMMLILTVSRSQGVAK